MKKHGIGLGAIAMAGVLAVGLVGPSEADARRATSKERAAMLSALRADNDAFADEPTRCRNTFVTRVAKARPRTGAIWMNYRLRTRRNCFLANGYVIMRRRSPKSTKWRVAWQGSEAPPCGLVTRRMSKEMRLGFGGKCLR